LARLIRERPVSVNVSRCRIRRSSKRRNSREYIDRKGLFQGEDGRSRSVRNRQTWLIGNLTGSGANRILESQSIEPISWQ
jgi:hypothetical protein